MLKSLFFVSKPLELLGAIEAKRQFNLKDCILVYSCKANTDKKTIEFLIKNHSDWTEVIFVKSKPYYGFFWVRLITKLKKGNYQFLFSRAFSTAGYFIHNLSYQKHYLLDDGAATIDISKEFKTNGNLTKRFSLFRGLNKTGKKYTLISFIYKILNVYVEKEVNSANFFTFYDIKESNKLEVVINKMKWLKELSKTSSPIQHKEIVYIIGTDIIQCKILNEEDYLNTILSIKAHYPAKKICYIPHLNEQESFINLLKQEGIFVQKNKFTIELDFILNNIIPLHIAGTISTALISLKLIYGSQITVDYFKFDSSKISAKNKPVLDNIYNYQNKFINPIKIEY